MGVFQLQCKTIVIKFFWICLQRSLTLPLVTVASHFVPQKFRQCMVVVEASSISEMMSTIEID
jgi:hypothetical protein